MTLKPYNMNLVAEYPYIRVASVSVPQEPQKVITSWKRKIIRSLIWVNILWLAVRKWGPIKGIAMGRKLKKLRDAYRDEKTILKYIAGNGRYHVSYNTPGWPSTAFNRYINHMLSRLAGMNGVSLHTLVFAITKKCGFQCMHCCEWNILNKEESLTREDCLLIIHRFYALGISQLHLSGGEPLNRFNDICYLLDHMPVGIDSWLYTTGYSLTHSKAAELKRLGLTGITISLDHHAASFHNNFRGVKDAFEKAINAISIARSKGLLVCLSLCATREFVSAENLAAYGEMARQNGVSFIQVLEPKAVGHYAGKDVLLREKERKLLEEFTIRMNYEPRFRDYPSVVYHGYNNRKVGCSGAAQDYVYVDTDGDVHNCPFCQRKLYSSFDEELQERLLATYSAGCHSLNFCLTK